jgi:hypothetical protein
VLLLALVSLALYFLVLGLLLMPGSLGLHLLMGTQLARRWSLVVLRVLGLLGSWSLLLASGHWVLDALLMVLPGK